ncbi:DNA alkylation repair protein [Haloimpatiens sp. FM7315]|uniref:DNA alkylation repair protein n=1 Tax=Haloimpatiens sp. FM7315 TaxID=3298609 RepID=UPI0035A3A53D
MNMENLKNIKWNNQTFNEFREMLYSLKDEEYKSFNEKIIPNIGKNIGIRTPVLKEIGKKLKQSDQVLKMYNFLDEEDIYEEKVLQGYLLPNLRYSDTKELFNNIDLYILRIDNWALCDGFVVNLKEAVNSNKESFFVRVKKYIRSNNPWEIRFGLVLLNNYFVDEKHIEDIFLLVKYINNNDYYVSMAIAWLMSTCYFFNKFLTLEFVTSEKLNKECIVKTLQKILESKKITDKDSAQLKNLKKKYI